MGKKGYKEIYEYECTISGEKFKVTRKAQNPEELISVQAYYDMNPEEDDRPAHIKKQFETKAE